MRMRQGSNRKMMQPAFTLVYIHNPGPDFTELPLTLLFIDKLNNSRGHQQEHRQSRLERRYGREQERANLIVPTLQLPPSHKHSHGNLDFYWDEEEQSWIRPSNHHSSNNARFTRSTPASPVRPPRDNYRCGSPENERPFSPVSPISNDGHGDYSDLMDQYQRRPSLDTIDQHERMINSRRPRPRSAIVLGQSPNISLGAFAWIY